MKKLASLIFLLFVCVSCTESVKRKVGMTTFGPNEYAVKRHKKLDIPSEFTLPTPKYKEVEKVKKKNGVQPDPSDEDMHQVQKAIRNVD